MNIYNKVYFVLLFITLISYLGGFGKKPRYVRMVILLMILWFFTSAVAIYLVKYGGLTNNLFVFHISTPLEYVILSMLFRDVIVNKAIKRIILLSVPFFVALSVLFSVFIQPVDTNNSNIIIIESVILVFISLFFLREILLLQQVTVLHRFPMFWICVGILFYYTGNLVIEGMLNYMIRQSMELARRTYRFGYIFKYLLFILFIIGAFCSKSPRLLTKKEQ
ncbi:MAG: hypothetical protein Q8941_01355 [Bacteroidota bacterium]|nr:hypothetical protein [Bacteroidota bacterium]